MDKLLTIGLPTFNRAELLDEQLAWLAKAIEGIESECEIVVSDNCSTDNTPAVIKRWQPIFDKTTFRVNRQSRNLGAIKNIAYCINAATSKHVWTISDDDQIDTKTPTFVLQVLKDQPNLALMILNFSTQHMETRELVKERWFDVDNDDVVSDGKALFERCLQVDKAGGVALTTALVYRTDLAQRALREWPASYRNLGFQIYVTGFCALHGSVKVTKEPHLVCLIGTHFWQKDRKRYLNFRYAEMLEVYVRLMQIGYSAQVCKRMALEQTTEMKWRFIKYCLRKWPITTMNVMSRHAAALLRVHLGSLAGV